MISPAWRRRTAASRAFAGVVPVISAAPCRASRACSLLECLDVPAEQQDGRLAFVERSFGPCGDGGDFRECEQAAEPAEVPAELLQIGAARERRAQLFRFGRALGLADQVGVEHLERAAGRARAQGRQAGLDLGARELEQDAAEHLAQLGERRDVAAGDHLERRGAPGHVAQAEGAEAPAEGVVRAVVGDALRGERAQVRLQLASVVQDEGAGHRDRASGARRELAVDEPSCASRPGSSHVRFVDDQQVGLEREGDLAAPPPTLPASPAR